MNTYIALLRGINVGGHKKILMADLRTLFEKMGFENVRTYIQSGNVVFQTKEDNLDVIEDRLKHQIFKQYNFEVPILITTRKELKSIIKNCPFSQEKMEKSHFTLLFTPPLKELIHETNKVNYPNEEFSITKKCIYFYCSMGYTRVKCNGNFFEKKLKEVSTSRNYRTLMKLMELSS